MKPGPNREALWAEVERELRRLLRAYDREPEWALERPEAELARAVRPLLERLSGSSRGGRGSRPETPP